MASYFLKGQNMQSALTSLTNPQWANSGHTTINCDITTSQFGNEVLPFTASPDDVEPHGRAIFADLVAGVYGPIAEYVAPPEPIQPVTEGAQTL